MSTPYHRNQKNNSQSKTPSQRLSSKVSRARLRWLSAQKTRRRARCTLICASRKWPTFT